jgi:outer membrane protein assembly factor BamD (BamD/ComL family)
VVRIFVLIFVLLLNASFAHAEGSRKLYQSGKRSARQGDEGYAFMFFQDLLKDFPDSHYAPDALFACAEYYFQMGALTDARQLFLKFVNDYPENRSRPFALVHLAKIASSQGQEEVARSLQKEIVVSQQLVLLFREFKEFQYVSALNRKHKVVHFIDRVEFYRDGELFEQISY